ncbi:ML5 [Symbiodinium natans]|uniref:ML5 protein n=1 Tax=Symbiodinium natans TaxID=878477 RepID=A0A812ULQ0_9DINO|nr:ML5 [Symbiodinium natans]
MERHGHVGSTSQRERGPAGASDVTLQLTPALARQVTMEDCGRAFGMFGEVAQLDLTRLRNAGSVRVRFFEVGAAHALREYLRHGSLWRPTPVVEDANGVPRSVLREPMGSREPGHTLECASDSQAVRNNLEIDEERLLNGQETRCSLMIGQVSKNCDSVLLLEKLREIDLLHRLRFFYMPIDKSRKRHFGYVFLEVSSPQDVIALLRRLPRLGELLGTARSNRQLHLHFARIQGWKNFMRQYSDLDFIFEPNANVRPQLFLPHRSSETDGGFKDLLAADLSKTYLNPEYRSR